MLVSRNRNAHTINAYSAQALVISVNLKTPFAPASASPRTSHSCLLPLAIPPACYFPTLASLPEALPSPASLPHRPSSLSCPSLSQSPHNQLPINIICSPSSMQTCSVRCSRPDPTVPGWRCSCHSSFASRLIQRLHAGSPSLCRSLGTAIFAPAPYASVMADARSATLNASAPLALVLADARSATLLA